MRRLWRGLLCSTLPLAIVSACVGDDTNARSGDDAGLGDAGNPPTDALVNGDTVTADADAAPVKSPRIEVDASKLVLAIDGAFALPGWLVIDSPSSNKTTQISPSALKMAIGANRARARNVGRGLGINVEPARTNECYPHTPPTMVPSPTPQGVWELATGGVNISQTETGPSGAAGTASKIAMGTNDFSAHGTTIAAATSTEVVTTSLWARRIDGATSFQLRVQNATPGFFEIPSFGAGQWSRGSLTGVETMGTRRCIILDARDNFLGATQEAVTTAVFGCQYEKSKYPTSLIATTLSGAETRATETLYATNGADWLDKDGNLDLEVVIAPNYASGESTGLHHLVYVDDATRLTVTPNSEIVFRAGGSELKSGPLTWPRNAPLTFRLRANALEQVLDVSGTMAPAKFTGPKPANPIVAPAKIYLLSTASGATDAADLQALRIY